MENKEEDTLFSIMKPAFLKINSVKLSMPLPKSDVLRFP
jgi:hypothetical protein